MRLRKQALGDRNLIGSRVEAARKKQGMKQKELLAQLQVSGVDMNASIGSIGGLVIGPDRLDYIFYHLLGKPQLIHPLKK